MYLKLKVNPRLITEILSRGQYSQLKTVIAEYVANAWDADATTVRITIPQTPGAAITIEDDGEGIDLAAFAEVARDRQAVNTHTKSGRPVLGRKGVGRWSGFAVSSRLVFNTRRNGTESELVIDKKALLEQKDLLDYELEPSIRPTTLPNGTTVTLQPSQPRLAIVADQIAEDLLLEFSLSQDFTIIVNDVPLTQEQLPGTFHRIQGNSPVFGHVEGFIHVTAGTKHKRPPGVIIRVKGRRVVGPEFFGVDGDYQSKVLDRLIGELSADDLEDAVTSDRESFVEWDDRYKCLKSWLRNQISVVAASVQSDEGSDVVSEILSLAQVQRRYNVLPEHMKAAYVRAVTDMAPKLGRIRKDRPLLTLFAVLLLRAIQEVDFHRILLKLEATDTQDIATLAKALEEWGFGEIARAAHLIQERIQVLNKFAEMVQNDATLELQHIHRVLERNTWILDDRFSLFSSNEQLRTVARKLGGTKTGRHATERPDLILKRDRRDFVLIELKRPKEPISMEHAGQILTYRAELRKQFTQMRDLDLYLIGREYDEVVLETYGPGNTQRLHILSLNEVVTDCQDRLRWLQNEFSDERKAAEEALATMEGEVSPWTALEPID